MAGDAEVVQESCYYVWQISKNFSGSISSETFGKEHLKWKLEYLDGNSEHLYLNLISAPFSTVTIQYNIQTTDSDFRNLSTAAEGVYEIMWHDKLENAAMIFSSVISKLFSHRQAVILNFKKQVSESYQDDGHMNFVIDIKAECHQDSSKSIKSLQQEAMINNSVYSLEASKLLSSMLENPEFSDLTLKVGSSKFPVHKSVLSLVSPVFRKRLLDISSNSSNEMEINDISEDVSKLFITYIYTGIVLIPDYQNSIELLKAAEVYDISGLKAPCVEYIKKKLNQNNVIQVILNAELYNAPDLREYAMEFFLTKIKKYDSSDFEEIKKAKPSLFPILCSKMTEMQANLKTTAAKRKKRS